MEATISSIIYLGCAGLFLLSREDEPECANASLSSVCTGRTYEVLKVRELLTSMTTFKTSVSQ